MGTLLGLSLLILVIWILWSLRRKFVGKDNRHKYFAQTFKDFPIYYNAMTRSRKEQLFERLKNLESHNEELRKQKSLRVLEVGAGSGANFEFYPSNIRLTVVDPNPYFKEHLETTLKNHPNIVLERYVVSGAESMTSIPTGSVDVVVSTIVLCSAENIPKILSEVKRILSPGGKFFFMEHVLEEEKLLQRLVQIFFGTFGIWPFVCDGCCPHRNIELELRKSNFAALDLKKFRLDYGKYYGLYMIEPHIMGVATA